MSKVENSKAPKIHWITGYDPAAAILAHKGFAEVTFKGLVPLLGHVIVTLEDEAHHRRRSLEGRLFVSGLLRAYERDLIPPIIEDTLRPYLEAGKGNLVEIGQGVTSQVAARLIGLDGLEAPDTALEAVRLLSALVGGTASSHGSHPPMTRRQARNLLRQRFIDSALERRRNLVQQYRAGRKRREDLAFDLITLLLLHAEGWTTQQIAAEVAFYAVAAIDTTATLIPHLMHELWQFLKLRPESTPRLEDLNFLRLAAAEALRLHPVLPTLFQQARYPIGVAGIRFEAGEVAGLYVGRANLDPAVFGPDASSFNPFREIRPQTRRAGLSFGGGAHLCLGRELALGRTGVGGQELEGVEEGDEGIFGVAALLAQALFRHKIRPDPAFTVPTLQPYERDVYHSYPVLLSLS